MGSELGRSRRSLCLRRGGWGGGGERVGLLGESLVPVGCPPGAPRHPPPSESCPRHLFHQSLIRSVTLTSICSDDIKWAELITAAAAVKEAAAGEDGKVLDINIGPGSKSSDFGHCTSSSHPYHPSPLNGQLKLFRILHKSPQSPDVLSQF